MMTSSINIGSKLKALREAKGWTKNELSNMTAPDGRVAHSHIKRIENGDIQNPGVGTVEKLAKALGKTLANLYI